MTAKVITLGIQKGGCGKTTTTGIVAHVLTHEYNKRVLVVDMDSQGNQTEYLTRCDIYEFDERTIFEALKEGDVRPYIVKLEDNLHLVPATDVLATFSYWLYHDGKHIYPENNAMHLKALRKALEPVLNDYDYILIDTPPHIGEQTLNSLVASDYVVVMFESSKFCLSAVERFIETVEFVQGSTGQELNPKLQVAGILRNLNDKRRSDMKDLVELCGDQYPDWVFESVIDRTAATGRLALTGFDQSENKELRKAIDPYHEFVKELLARVE
ncbi:AAA family ATPase (plasmid) [Alicyclobacillus fastidiosus]|uniref:AAA family ATPase n=1 Tax=Alicyclobacillus fastidiosus TaxID=392011 RepID=A0ABY6ZS93_9BACL|nr:AAA family ATPase [Alicyclobacillus fastidiosus]WAH44825.1 AAA family ATPase [Alicyclobacillus fastidiosus]GMA65790.1 chromosome partitioning protein ParA [Alicyclobacillus fastidiosus]GMA65862.1 chromosome partitioning protein ParA [Alicyclobacillus fastidiosus]